MANKNVVIGRIVHHVDDMGHERPAIITAVWSPTTVNLQAFKEPSFDGMGQGTIPWTSVVYSDQMAHMTWHWPDDCKGGK